MDDSHNYVKQNKQVVKEYRHYDSISVMFTNTQNNTTYCVGRHIFIIKL